MAAPCCPRRLDLTDLGIVASFVDPPDPDPSGRRPRRRIVDRRPTDAIWQNNVLTFASTEPCDPRRRRQRDRDCARVTQLNTSTATPTRVQDMLIATTGAGHLVPGHRPVPERHPPRRLHPVDRDRGHVVVRPLPAPVRRDQRTQFCTRDRGRRGRRLPRRPLGPLRRRRPGSARHERRLAGQPVHEVRRRRGARASASSRPPGTTFVGIAPVRLLDSRINIGTTGPFTSSVPKTIDIAGRLGIPNDAVAITGNLTSTGQQQAGYASLTPLPDANPATSTINFPLGDNRANNLTSPLSNAGGVSLTYKASPGKQTHFMLDVTGYFLNDDTGDTYKVLTPVRVLDTRFDVGLNSAFQANTNRAFQVAGVWRVPANAMAITGNLTVSSQTGAGFVTLSTTPPPANPADVDDQLPGRRHAGERRDHQALGHRRTLGRLQGAARQDDPSDPRRHRLLRRRPHRRPVRAAHAGSADGHPVPGPAGGPDRAVRANIARTLVIEPYQGVPANATAITGNLTVVGQTRAGLRVDDPGRDQHSGRPRRSTSRSATPGRTASPDRSAVPGNVGLVYKASGGQTHLILDITGYFR